MKISALGIIGCFLAVFTVCSKVQAQCPVGYSEIIVNIVPDTYPNETTWDIKDAANNIVANGTTNSDTICYPTGSLLYFTIHDSYGDGICCAHGNGSFNVYIDGDLVGGGGQFAFNNTVIFNYPPGQVATALMNALQQLNDHCNTAFLSPSQINALADTIQFYHLYFAQTLPVVSAAFDLVNCYEANPGPLFLNSATTGGFPNAPGALDGYEYDRVVFLVQQQLFTQFYTKDKIEQNVNFVNGKKFLTSDYFPGACPLPFDSTLVYTSTINATMQTEWGKPTAWSSTPARRPTGYYLAPGTIGKVKVPNAMVNTGYKILVGAHPTKSTTGQPTVKRFFGVCNTFDITDSVTLIANPFGGGIYIITPYQSWAGLQQIELTNVVPAPFFSAKSFDQTTLSEWQNVQRHHPAPWADFESEKFMMQVPTSFIYNYDDPATLMDDWDARMDVVSNLLGYPLVRNNLVLYVMLDVQILYSVYGIGFPQINNLYTPSDVQNGNSSHWFLTPGAASMWETEFHELGHSQLMEKFEGEAEAIVNLPAATIYNQLYGIDLDTAFGMSFGNQPWIGRDEAAINWMVTHNFRAGNPMDISNTTLDEVRYQHRGYGKYVEIAALFGWDALKAYYQQVNFDYNNAIPPGPLGEVDDRILKLSIAAGADLRPLIHFWGVQPEDSAALAQAIQNNGLQPSALICNRLAHYLSIIPMDNAQFNQHAVDFFNGPVPPGGDPDYGNGWYNVWLPLYNNTHGDSAVISLQKIIDTYFPDGCDVLASPEVEQVGYTRLYPNPVQNLLHIVSSETIQHVVVYNVLGQELVNMKPNKLHASIDTEPLASGSYYIKINDAEIKRFVKQ